MATAAEIGRAFKSAYPGRYDKESDEALGQVLLKTHPERFSKYLDAPAPAVEAPKPEEKTLAGFGSNVVNSGAKYLKNLVEGISSIPGAVAGAVTSPIETAKGVFEKAPAVAGALANDYKQAYGGVQNIMDTLYNDPFRVAADVSTVATGGAGALSKLGVLPKAAKAMAVAGEVTNPLNMILPTPSNTAVRGLDVIPQVARKKQDWANRLYASSLVGLPTGSAERVATAQKAVQSGLKHEIPVTKKGATKLQKVLDAVDSAKEDIVAKASPTDTVDLFQAATKTDSLRKKHQNVAAPSAYVKRLDSVVDEFLNTHGLSATVQKAHEIKKATGEAARDLPKRSQKRRVFDLINSGISDEIGSKLPGYKPLNMEEVGLLRLKEAMTNSLLREQKKKLFGLLGGAYGGINIPIAAARHVVDRPGVKSRLAVSLANPSARPATHTANVLNALQLLERPEQDETEPE
jgi:hypothetical protein